MAHWKIKDETTLATLAELPTLEAAEAWIAEREKTDPAGVHAGNYGIDGPCPDPGETIVNEGGDEIHGQPIQDLAAKVSEIVGFAIAEGTVLVMLCSTIGQDHECEEHELAAGALAIVDSIELIGGDQGLGIHLMIPVDASADLADDDTAHIVNTFDEGDTKDRFAFRLATQEERAKLHPSWLRDLPAGNDYAPLTADECEEYLHTTFLDDIPGTEWDESGRAITDPAALVAHILKERQT